MALRRGDASAASALYARARPHVDRTIVGLLRTRGADHEDLVQISLIELVRSMGKFRGDCALDTWISRITARTVFKELRRLKAQRRLLQSVTDTDPPSTSGDLERQLGARAIVARIQKHFDAMDEAKVWTVVLHDVCGYDLREIAEITDASVSAAQSRLARGRAELHARLERDPELRAALERKEGRK